MLAKLFVGAYATLIFFVCAVQFVEILRVETQMQSFSIFQNASIVGEDADGNKVGYTSEECFGAFLCSQLMSRILRSIDVSFVSIDLYWSAEQRQRLNASETWRWPAEWPLAILALAALLSAALLTLLLVIFCLTSSRSLATKPALLLRAFIYLSLGVGLVTGSIFQALSRTHLLGLLDYTSHVLLAAFSVFPLLFFELIIFAYQQEVVFADNPDIRDASVLYSKLLLET